MSVRRFIEVREDQLNTLPMNNTPQALISETIAQFEANYGSKPEYTSVAPGRVEVLGNHTDYNGGYILSAAIDKRTCVASTKNHGQMLDLIALDIPDQTEAKLSDLKHDEAHKWADYPIGVAVEILKLEPQPQLGGAKLAIHSGIPFGSGLSSSAALEVATMMALKAMYPFEIDPMAIAQLCQKAENRFVGVSSGLMDQFSSVFGKQDSLLFLDCQTLEHEAITLKPLKPISLVVCNSMVRHTLTGSEYNTRRAECMSAAKKLGHELLRDVAMQDLEDGKSKLTDHEYRRAKHVVGENERVLRARDAARAGDMTTLGKLMFESHESSRKDFENSTPELDRLVDFAHDLEECYGARLTGGGFGGSVLALVDQDNAEQFSGEIGERYGETIGKLPDISICEISDGAQSWKVAP